MEQKKFALREHPNDSTIHDIRTPYSDNFEQMGSSLFTTENHGPRRVMQIIQSQRESGNGMVRRTAARTIRMLLIVLRVVIQDSSFQSPSKLSSKFARTSVV